MGANIAVWPSEDKDGVFGLELLHCQSAAHLMRYKGPMTSILAPEAESIKEPLHVL